MAQPVMFEKQEPLSKEGSYSAEIPAPATAPRTERKRRFRRGLLHLVGLLGLVYLIGSPYLSTSTPRDHKHYGLVKPKGPLKPEDARKLFLTIPEADSALGAARLYATHPHLAGSTNDFKDATTLLELFQNEFNIVAPPEQPIYPAGSDLSQIATRSVVNSSAPSAWVDIYYPVLNTPLDRSLTILGDDGNPVFSADLVEDGDPRDPEAAKYKDAVPTFHGLSRDGDVTGQLVYANYGSKDDYDKLAKDGVDLAGKIVLTRYGGIFRGLKIKGAEELGAAGVLVYSDPRDDGHVTVENGYEAYPAGPARNPTAVQRGSVQYLSSYPGDPTTPGYPAYENSTRTEGTNIPKIPSLPISWANAQRLLEELGGVDKGRQLNGKFSEKKIHLVNHVDTKVTPIWNTYAAIPGHIKDEVILLGNHRDAWVMGAADPTSGTVSLRELVRGFGFLLRNGWKPLRTILIASWDAEEYGLVGSTEWGEDFPEWIQKHVVTYLNLDVSVSGSRWHSSASPSLSHLIRANALQVPYANKTLWDARTASGPFTDGSADAGFMAAWAEDQHEKLSAMREDSPGIPPLGSGSDYTVFLQRLGVASIDQGFGYTPTDSVYHYHSIYDSQHWEETYGDPGFHRHVAVAKHLGLLALSLTDSIILPLNTTQYALELGTYLDKVEDIAAGLSLSRSPNFRILRKAIGKLQHASAHLDREKTTAEKQFKKALRRLEKVVGGKDACAHHRHFQRLRSWIKRVFGVDPSLRTVHTARRVEELADRVWAAVATGDQVALGALVREHANGGHHDNKEELKKAIKRFIKAAKRVRKANQKLIAFERGFIDEAGIKDREWYRHLGVAPGKWLGYGATTLPAVTEALTIDHNPKLAEKEAKRLSNLLVHIAKGLEA